MTKVFCDECGKEVEQHISVPSRKNITVCFTLSFYYDRQYIMSPGDYCLSCLVKFSCIAKDAPPSKKL